MNLVVVLLTTAMEGEPEEDPQGKPEGEPQGESQREPQVEPHEEPQGESRVLEETGYVRRLTLKIKTTYSTAVYVGSSLTVHNPILFSDPKS